MSEDNRKTIRDMLDGLDDYFEDLERDIQEVVRKSFESANIQRP